MASGRPSRRRQIPRRPRVVVGQREVVADGLGPVDEQPHGGQRRQLLERRPLGERRHRQRPTGYSRSARSRSTVRLVARIRRRGSAPGADRARRRRRRPARGCPARAASACPRSARRDVERRASALDGGADRRRDPGSTSSGWTIARAPRTPSPADSVVELLADGDRQPRLADAAGAAERDQPDAGASSSRDLGDVVLAPDQRRRRRRSERGPPPVVQGAGDAGRSARPRVEPLAQEQREVVAHQPPELARAYGTSGTSRCPPPGARRSWPSAAARARAPAP